jgi:hypothetical protein
MHAIDSHDAEPRLTAAEPFRVAEAPEAIRPDQSGKAGDDMVARDTGSADAPAGRAYHDRQVQKHPLAGH